MSWSGWRSIVSVGDQTFTGDGRVYREGAMFSATRAALKELGLPCAVQISNEKAQSA